MVLSSSYDSYAPSKVSYRAGVIAAIQAVKVHRDTYSEQPVMHEEQLIALHRRTRASLSIAAAPRMEGEGEGDGDGGNGAEISFDSVPGAVVGFKHGKRCK